MTNNSGRHDHSATNHQVYLRLVLYPIVKHLDLSRCPLLHKSLIKQSDNFAVKSVTFAYFLFLNSSETTLFECSE